eukprot:PhF_6_TR12569/c0_g1_i1/m.19719
MKNTPASPTILRYAVVAIVSSILTATFLSSKTTVPSDGTGGSSPNPCKRSTYNPFHVASRSLTASTSNDLWKHLRPATFHADKLPFPINYTQVCDPDDVTTCMKSPSDISSTDICQLYGPPPKRKEKYDMSSWPKIIPRYHDEPPPYPSQPTPIRILFSVSVEHPWSPQCLADQALNFLRYAPNSAVIYHLPQQSMYWDARRAVGEIIPLKYQSRVLLNPLYVSFTLLHQHIINVQYSRNFFRHGHVVFYSIADMIVKPGIEEYILPYEGVDYTHAHSKSPDADWEEPITKSTRPRFVPLPTLLKFGGTAPRWFTPERLYCDSALRLAMRRSRGEHFPTAPVMWDGTFMSADTFAVFEYALAFAGHFQSISDWYVVHFYPSAILYDYLAFKPKKPMLSEFYRHAVLDIGGVHTVRSMPYRYSVRPVNQLLRDAVRLHIRITQLNAEEYTPACDITNITSCGYDPSELKRVDICNRLERNHSATPTERLFMAPDPPKTKPYYKILVSTECFECPLCTIDQIANIRYYCPECYVVINARSGVYHELSQLMEKYRMKDTATINAEATVTRRMAATVLVTHFFNIRYASNYVNWDRAVIFSSNEMMFRPGLADYLMSYEGIDYQSVETAVPDIEWIELKTLSTVPLFIPFDQALKYNNLMPQTWYTPQRLYCDKYLLRTMKALGAYEIPTAPVSFEGTFFSKEIWDTVNAVFPYDAPWLELPEYLAEHHYPPILFHHLLKGKRVAPLVTEFARHVEVTEDFINTLMQNNPRRYSVKRVERNIQNKLRAWFRKRRGDDTVYS